MCAAAFAVTSNTVYVEQLDTGLEEGMELARASDVYGTVVGFVSVHHPQIS